MFNSRKVLNLARIPFYIVKNTIAYNNLSTGLVMAI